MTTQFTPGPIKLEGVDASESVTEIQSYLAGFQKEIEGSDGTIQQVTGMYFLLLLLFLDIKSERKALEAEGEDNDGDGEGGTYFVDQAGHYYYQAKGEGQPVMTVMSAAINEVAGEEGEEFIINQENDDEGDEGEEVSFIVENSVIVCIINRLYRR